MTSVLVVSPESDAHKLAIERVADGPINLQVCTSTKEALERYDAHQVLFGNPDLIAAVLPDLPEVRWVQSTWAGVTPLINCARRDYVLTGVRDVFGPQMSEYVMGYILAKELRVFERLQHQQQQHWFNAPSSTLPGKRIGIMGTGSIARHIARTARCFGLQVTGLSRSGAAVSEFDAVMPVSELHHFLTDLDFLVSVLPDTAETHGLLDGAALACLPDTACYINIGRGNVVDSDALVDALQANQLAGAVLDVFTEEPMPANSPLWDVQNLLVTAHVAAMSHPDLIAPIFVENLRRFESGRALNYVVDFDAGY